MRLAAPSLHYITARVLATPAFSEMNYERYKYQILLIIRPKVK